MKNEIENIVAQTSKFRKLSEIFFLVLGLNIVGFRKHSKRPIGKWAHYQNERQTEAEAFGLPWHLLTGLGIVLGPIGNLYAFDIDKPEGIDVAYHILDLLGLPKDYPWLVKTGGDGFHIYFKSHNLLEQFGGQKVIVYTESGLRCKQIELRINGLIVAPGSIHASAKPYEFVTPHDFDKEITFIDASKVAEVASKLEPPKHASAPDLKPDEPVPSAEKEFDQVAYEWAVDLVGQLKEKQISPSLISNYSSWVNDLLLPIGNDFGERGREIFHELSSLSSKYDKVKCDEYYSNYLKGNTKYKKNKRTMRSFFYAFRQIGIKPRVNRTAELQPEKNNRFHTSIKILTDRHSIKRDTFTDTVYFDGKPLDDREINTALIYLTSKFNFGGITKDYIVSLCESDYIEEFHRIDDLVINYKPTDATGNIKRISATLVTETAADVFVTWRGEQRPLKEVVIELFLVKMVKQFYELVANDFCLVLLGDMHVGKTYWLTHLLPSPINDLVRITQFSNDKDFKVQLCESALLAIDEIREKDMSSNEFMKMTMSMPQFSLRVPYGRKPKMRKRIASLAGTGNNRFILRDPAGNRRFVPIWLESIDKDAFNLVDKMDLFYEVYTLYKSGYDTNLTEELLEAISNLSKDFEIRTEADETLLEQCPPWNPKDPNVQLLSVGEMKDLILERTSRNLTYTQIGMSIQRLGYESKTVVNTTYNGNKSKVWKYYCCTDLSLNQGKPKSAMDDYFNSQGEPTKIYLNGNGEMVVDVLD